MTKAQTLFLGIALLFCADAQAEDSFDPIAGLIKGELLDLESFYGRHPEALPREGAMGLNFGIGCNFGQGC